MAFAIVIKDLLWYETKVGYATTTNLKIIIELSKFMQMILFVVLAVFINTF